MKFKYNITGLDCPNCAAKLAASMEKIEGVVSAKINFLTEKLNLRNALDKRSSKRSVGLISHEKHGAFLSPKIVL